MALTRGLRRVSFLGFHNPETLFGSLKVQPVRGVEFHSHGEGKEVNLD
jgi:hypothetical protein